MRRRLRVAVGVVAGAISMAGLTPLALTAPAAAAELSLAQRVGPTDQRYAYPMWFSDNGLERDGLTLDPVRLELCLDPNDLLCPTAEPLPDPGAQPSVPENFTEEAFWWSGEALMDTPSGASARLIMAQEAAFGGPGEIAYGQQVAFQRLRIRIDDAVPFAQYTVTSPYGVDVVEADDRGRVRMTEDAGCLSPPCDWKQALNGRLSTFLRWDPRVGPAAPEGYVGDPGVEHQVVGSPFGTNFFRIEGPGIGGPGVNSAETNLFTVQGRFAQPRGTVSLPGDLYAPGTNVEIIPSFPGEAQIFWTTDPTVTDEQLSAARAEVTDESTNAVLVHAFQSTTGTPNATVPLPADGKATLRYVVRLGDDVSDVYEEEYEVRDGLSVVSLDPGLPEDSSVLYGRQEFRLKASIPGRIYYTLDGTRPRIDEDGEPLGSTKEYDQGENELDREKIVVTRTTTLRAVSLPDAPPPPPEPEPGTEPPAEAPAEPVAPKPGPVSTFHVVIHNLTDVSKDKLAGYPFSLTDIPVPSKNIEPVALELCLDDPLCPVIGEVPDPTRGVSFPDNFPDESFWWSADALFEVGEIRARLVLALEAAFDSATIQDDHQVAFGRIRVRIDDVVPGATYEIIHPYGVVRATADDRGRLFYTDDVGCMSGPCGEFGGLYTQPIGPVLRWDPSVGPAAPQGYVGDPNVEHKVIGSPYDTNVFDVKQVTGPNGAELRDPIPLGSTDLFAVQGKIAGPGAIPSWKSGAFNHELDVTLTGNPLTTEILYTTDGSDPRESGRLYSGPIHVDEGTTNLQYVARGEGGTSSAVKSETYTVDMTAPEVTASVSGGTFDAVQNVTLSSPEATARIYYTLDGTTPTTNSPSYGGGVIRIDQTSTLQAIAVDALGNASEPKSWTFTINLPAPPAADTGTTPGAAQRAPEVQVAPAVAGPVRAGETTALNGVLAIDGQAVGGAPVVLQSREVLPQGGRVTPVWVDETSTTTAVDGSFKFRGIKPKATTDFRVAFPGDGQHAPTVSPVTRLKVRAVVDLARTPHKVGRKDHLVLRGKLSAGQPGTTVLVKLDARGKRHDKVVRATVDARGKWKAVTRAPAKTGRMKVVAVWKGDGVTLGDRSRTRSVRVVR